jgi:hypothetical protein
MDSKFKITAFLKLVHRPEFKINRKGNVSETGSAFVLRGGERDA